MSENVYDILELCIAALDRGESLEACLARYPKYANELRPLLETLTQTYEAAVLDLPATTKQHARARIFNHAAEMRARVLPQQNRPSFGSAIARVFNKTAAILVLLLIFALGGTTGLVYASNRSLPGDQLYPVKRTWEDVRLQFTFSSQIRAALEAEFDLERLTEINELVARGRIEKVEFTGQVTGIFPGRLLVTGIGVFLDARTQMPAKLALNQLVQVIGETRADGTVLGVQIMLIDSNDVTNSVENNNEATPAANTPSGGTVEGGATESPGSEPGDMPTAQPTQAARPTSGGVEPGEQSTPEPTHSSSTEHNDFQLEGVVQQMNQNNWVVGNQQIIIDPHAEINGEILVGSFVTIEGYVDANGNLIATHVELRRSPPNLTPTPTGGSSGGGEDDHSGDNKTPTPDH